MDFMALTAVIFTGTTLFSVIILLNKNKYFFTIFNFQQYLLSRIHHHTLSEL